MLTCSLAHGGGSCWRSSSAVGDSRTDARTGAVAVASWAARKRAGAAWFIRRVYATFGAEDKDGLILRLAGRRRWAGGARWRAPGQSVAGSDNSLMMIAALIRARWLNP